MVGNSHLQRQLRELYKCPSFEEQLVEQGKEKDFFNAKQFPLSFPFDQTRPQWSGFFVVGDLRQGDTLSVMRYNLLNLPEEDVLAGRAKERFVYSADGEKLFVQHITASSDTTGTEYAANYRFENDTLAMIHTDAGYYTPVPPLSGTGSLSFMHVWYLKDHLGNNRVLADGTGTALKIHHYDPFGEPITIAPTGGSPVPSPSFPAGATESPYKYGGKEWSEATLTYDFEARQFSPDFHRFTTMDPLCEKYYGISPYAYCANNPVNLVDPEGLTDWRAVGKGTLTMIGGVGTTAGGVALAMGTGGTATPLSAYLVIE